MGRLIIVGPRRTQNELLADFFRNNLPVEEDIKTVNSINEIGRSHGPCICLVDCAGSDMSGVESETLRFLSYLDDSSALAMFNVTPNNGVESNLVSMGVRGVFFEGDTPETVKRGTKALLCGEVWASRMALSQCVGKTHSRLEDRKRQELPNLSPREIEVLRLVAEGMNDEAISEHLCISSATVKTHLYKTFRKIQVNNRLQAALWATKNL